MDEIKAITRDTWNQANAAKRARIIEISRRAAQAKTYSELLPAMVSRKNCVLINIFFLYFNDFLLSILLFRTIFVHSRMAGNSTMFKINMLDDVNHEMNIKNEFYFLTFHSVYNNNVCSIKTRPIMNSSFERRNQIERCFKSCSKRIFCH